VKIRLAVCWLLLAVLPIAPLWSRTHHAAAQDPSDPGYMFALAAADHFLHAWQTGDIENGMVQLSDGIRRSQNADTLEKFFSDGKDRSFEIARGHGHPARYSFPVVLHFSRGSHATRQSSQMILIDTGKNDWVVDKLP